MSKTLTIRKSAEDEKWLGNQERRTGRSQGTIVKSLLASAREQKAAASPVAAFIGDLTLKDRKASTRKGFSR